MHNKCEDMISSGNTKKKNRCCSLADWHGIVTTTQGT